VCSKAYLPNFSIKKKTKTTYFFYQRKKQKQKSNHKIKIHGPCKPINIPITPHTRTVRAFDPRPLQNLRYINLHKKTQVQNTKLVSLSQHKDPLATTS